MVKVKVSELTGPALDWAAANCMGYVHSDGNVYLNCWAPSTEWSQGGPILEMLEIGVKRNSPCSRGREWEASPSITAKGAGGKYGYGPTPLIAAMRCFVASKLGEEVKIPKELMK